MFTTNFKHACMEWTSKNQTIPDVCAAFKSTKILRQADDETATDALLIEVNDHNRDRYEFTVSVDTLVNLDALLSTFVAHRLTVSHYMQHALSEHLMAEYRQLCAENVIEYRHSRLGWTRIGDKDYFLYDSTPIGSHVSKCSRKNFKFRRGSEETYRQFLAETVYPVPTLALALAIGYSAPVITRLKDVVDTGEAVIVNLCGASSTGKTTVEQLMVSPFASPTVSNKDGLIRTFHATNNAIFAGIDGIYGLPVVLDDVTTNPNIDLPNLIYTLASGEEKGRCTSDGKLRQDHEGWSGVVVISSETPIQEQSLQNQGLKVRVLHTQGITWTPSAEVAELIKCTVQQNYGFTGNEFAQQIAKIPMEKLLKAFQESRTRVRALMVKRDNLSDRLETKYAAIYLTVRLMNAHFKLALNADELLGILLAPEQASVDERDISKKALSLVQEFVAQKFNHFSLLHDKSIQDTADRHASGDSYGFIREKGYCREVYVLPSVVKELLERNGIHEITTVKSRWRDSGVIFCEKDRYDKKFNGVRYMIFHFENDKPKRIALPPSQPISTVAVDSSNVSVEEVF